MKNDLLSALFMILINGLACHTTAANTLITQCTELSFGIKNARKNCVVFEVSLKVN